jgi:hypothetical protein
VKRIEAVESRSVDGYGAESGAAALAEGDRARFPLAALKVLGHVRKAHRQLQEG